MEYCVTSDVMKNSDANTIKNGISGIELMKRAANAVYESYDYSCKDIAILCGKGNNGGDGYALAYIMILNGLKPVIYNLGEPKTEESKYYYNKLKELEFKDFYNIDSLSLNYDILVDCIFGVGFSREISNDLKLIFSNINNNFKGKVISVDIPSGLNSDNGSGRNAIIADMTIAIQSYKLGHFLLDGKDKCGNLIKCDIGIKIIGEKIPIIDSEFIKKFFPKRLNNSNKGTYGKNAIIGGSINYMGAAKLTAIAESSLRVGCGLSTLAVPSSLINSVLNMSLDNTVYELADKDGYLLFDKPSIDNLIKGKDALAIGMGIGQHFDENNNILNYIISNFQGKILIDADGLNSLSKNIDILFQSKADIILTPHPMEMARLINSSLESVLNNPYKIIKEFSNRYNVTVLLKGTSTLVVNNQNTFLITNGIPAQAKAGSGDVLSGCILGLLSRGISCVEAGACATYICAEAAKISQEINGEYGVLAKDVANNISIATKNIINNDEY